MDRRNRMRAALPRVLKALLVIAAYGAVLAWASDIATVDAAAASMREAVMTAGSAASSHVQEATSATAATLQGAPREAPLMTLAVAGVLILAAAAWYAIRFLRSRVPLLRRARLVVRYITTLI